MFTGIVEEIGSLQNIQSLAQGRRFTIQCRKVLEKLAVDDSISVNGVCQTVVALHSDSFDVESVPETLKKTTLGDLHNGAAVNLERAMALGDRLGGHLVQGHVDCRGTVCFVRPEGNSHLVNVSFPPEYARYVISVGSICIDGVSLTVASLGESDITVAIIPHTWKNTIIGSYAEGDKVNLEFDLIGKYIERLVHADGASPGGITRERLQRLG